MLTLAKSISGTAKTWETLGYLPQELRPATTVFALGADNAISDISAAQPMLLNINANTGEVRTYIYQGRTSFDLRLTCTYLTN